MKPKIQDDAYSTQTDRGPDSNKAAAPSVNRNVYLVVSMGFGVKSLPYQAFLERVAASVPATDLTAVLHAESILPHARRFADECDTVVNLDTLSGIGGVEEICFEDGQHDVRRFELHAGTWGDYVEFNRKERFVWGHPTKACSRDAKCRADVFNDPSDIAFQRITQKSGSAWKTLTHYTAKPPHYGVNVASVRAGALLLAPGRCSPLAVRWFLSIVKRHGLNMLDWCQKGLGDRWLFAEIERERLTA